MHGHALSGTRKLNRHWQSGSKKSTLEENLVYFERDLDVTEWKTHDAKYWLLDSDLVEIVSDSHESYNRRNTERSSMGFKNLVITEPGDYKVHWNLKTRNIERFTRNEEEWFRIVSGNKDDRFGLFGVVMYGMGQFINIATTQPYSQRTDNGIEWYPGQAADYLAHIGGGVGNLARSYYNSTIGVEVSPYRTSTGSWLAGANSFNMVSGQEEPELILHIGAKAPFPQYSLSRDIANKEVWFDLKGRYKSPFIRFLFVENISSLGIIEWIVTGKIWLERIGDYTEDTGWKSRIISAPDGYTILGDGGIIN